MNSNDTSRFTPPSLQEMARLFPQLEILALLGAGGMGAVYKARQPALDRMVALKILPAHDRSGPNFEERFNREARALARLSHPNIVAVHEFGRVEDLHYFIMEFVDGANLRQLEKAGRLSPREALQVIPQICDALQYAHDEGIVHRDIKPENVLVDRKGRVKIADFGLAKIISHDAESLRLTAEGQVMGTPHYMAPEQLERPLTVDHRADIYSLGVVFYEMLTGDLPLGKFPPPSRKVRVDVRLDEVVLRALENDPERRYQRASDVKTGVESIHSTEAPTERPAETVAGGGRTLRWAGIPVVIDREDGRSVSFNGLLAAIAAAFGLLTVGFLLVWLITGNAHSDGLAFKIPVIVAILMVVFGVRGALNRPSVSDAAQRRLFKRQILALTALPLIVVAVNWITQQLPELRSRFSRSQTIVGAAMDRDSGNLTARLPGGVTVELLAVSHASGALNRWWSPDGRLITSSLYEIPNPGRVIHESSVHRDLVFRCSGLPDGASGPHVEIDSAQGTAGGGTVVKDGHPLKGAWPVRVAVPPSIKRTTARLGFELEAWQSLAVHDVAKQTTTARGIAGYPHWRTSISHVDNVGGSSQVTVIHPALERDWHIRVIAIGRSGQEHPYTDGRMTLSERTEIWTYTFRDVPRDEVKEFHLQVRRIHWAEFRDVALHPRGVLPPPLLPEFGPVNEVTFDELIDFDTGATAGFPPGKPEENLFAGIAANIHWMMEKGYDAAAGTGQLDVSGMIFTVLEESDWDGLTPAELNRRLAQNHYMPRELKPLREGALPATFGFRTREHGTGILQLVGFAEDRPGATVRFKLIRQPPVP